MTLQTERPPLLDTNVPIYAAGDEHPYREDCRWVMTEIAHGRLFVAIDAELIQEILHRYSALGRYAEAFALATDVLTLIPNVYPITFADVQRTIALFLRCAPQSVRSCDVIHAAVMLNNGLTDIISTDRHFDLIEGINCLDPLALYRQALGQQM